MNEDEVIQRLTAAYPDALIDINGADCSFEVYIVTEAFKGKNLLVRQKEVLALFKEEITSGKLHALTVKAKTPDERSAASGLVQIQFSGLAL